MHELSGIVSGIVGTEVSADSPLMTVGVDSVGAADLATSLSDHFQMELPSTLLFDHPSSRAIANFITLQGDTSIGNRLQMAS